MTNGKWKMENGNASKSWPNCLFHLGIDYGDIGLQAVHGVVLVFFGQLEVCGGLVGVLAILPGLLGGGDQLAHEISIFFEVVPGHQRAVAGDNRFDALDAGRSLHQSLGIFQPAAAVAGVHDRRPLPGKQIAGVHDLQRWEDDESIAAGVATPEVIEINLIGAFQHTELVLVGLPGQELLAFLGLKRGHLLHVRLAVLVGDELDGAGEGAVAAHVVAVRMSIDDHNHGFGRDGFDHLQDARPVVRIFGVHHDDTLFRDESRSVTATARDHVQVVFDLLNFEFSRRVLLRLLLRGHQRNRASEQKPRQYYQSFHGNPPLMNCLPLSEPGSYTPISLDTRITTAIHERGSSGYGRKFRYANYKDWGGGDYKV